MTLENVLREVENRNADDTYRDPKKYFFQFLERPLRTSHGDGGWKAIIFH